MTRLKAWFVSLAVAVAAGFALHAGYLLAIDGLSLTWGGAALSNAALCVQLLIIMSRFSARTSENLPLAVGGAVIGAAMTIAGSLIEGVQPLALGYALFGLVAVLLYVFWYSRLGREASDDLVEGATLPALVFEDEDGNSVSTDDLREDGPLLLMFYRGNWCPLCSAQVRELAERYRELKARGVTVAFISPQSHENTRSIAARFDVPARFLVDVQFTAAKRLGIVHEGGLPAGLEALGYETDTVYPTVVIVDREGVILFSDETDNYRVRPEPDVFLAVLDGRDPRARAAPA